MKITVIGAGNMGSAFVSQLVRAGHQVSVTARHGAKAAQVAAANPGATFVEIEGASTGADAVILATGYADAAGALQAIGDLKGKVVIDITNPLTADYMGLTLGHSTSAAEEIAKAVPGAEVVKGFNTVFAQVLAEGAKFGKGQKVSVFVASDSPGAKQTASGRADEGPGRFGHRQRDLLMGAQGMNEAIIVQRPASASTAPAELLLLFHGVGSSAEDLLPLGRALAAQRPGAWIVSVRSPDPSDLGSGWQWFSVQGITEANRPARVNAALPAFLRGVAWWQGETGVAPEATTLIGFSQGAIMALEATQHHGPSPAGRVMSIAGRFSQAPRIAAAQTQLHLLHGELDQVMPIALAVDAQARLQLLGAAATLDRFPGLGHGIDARVVERILRRLPSETPVAPR